MNLKALAGKQSGRDLPLFPIPSQVNAKGLSNASVVTFALTRGQSAERGGRTR